MQRTFSLCVKQTNLDSCKDAIRSARKEDSSILFSFIRKKLFHDFGVMQLNGLSSNMLTSYLMFTLRIIGITNKKGTTNRDPAEGCWLRHDTEVMKTKIVNRPDGKTLSMVKKPQAA
jgi:hypothetical protein